MNTQEADRVEALCIEDYEHHVGKILKVKTVLGYRNDDCIEVYCDPPARVRVRKMRERDMLNWTCDDFCDPNWDVDMVEPHQALNGCSSLWVDGISRSIDGEIQHPTDWEIDENQNEGFWSAVNQRAAIAGITVTTETQTTIKCPSCGCDLCIDIKAA